MLAVGLVLPRTGRRSGAAPATVVPRLALDALAPEPVYVPIIDIMAPMLIGVALWTGWELGPPSSPDLKRPGLD